MNWTIWRTNWIVFCFKFLLLHNWIKWLLIIPEPNKSTQTNPPKSHQNSIWRSQSSPKEVHGKKYTKYTFKITGKSKLYLIKVNFFSENIFYFETVLYSGAPSWDTTGGKDLSINAFSGEKAGCAPWEASTGCCHSLVPPSYSRQWRLGTSRCTASAWGCHMLFKQWH